MRTASRVAFRLDRLELLTVLSREGVDDRSVRGLLVRESLCVVGLERLEVRSVLAGEGGDGSGVLLEERCKGVRVLVLQSLAGGVRVGTMTLRGMSLLRIAAE